MKTVPVLYRASEATQHRRNAAVYFFTGVWPTGFNLRLRWTTLNDDGKSVNPHWKGK